MNRNFGPSKITVMDRDFGPFFLFFFDSSKCTTSIRKFGPNFGLSKVTILDRPNLRFWTVILDRPKSLLGTVILYCPKLRLGIVILDRSKFWLWTVSENKIGNIFF